MHLLLALAIAVGTWTAWSAWALIGNYRIARRTKLPVIISPISTLNPLWIITYKVLFPSIIDILKILPVGLWPRCSYMGWQFDDKRRLHDTLGPAFIICTPSLNEVVVADPDAAHYVLHKRKDFTKPAIMYEGLNAFGKNLDSVEGETWQRHRKLTAPNFNEKVSSAVWDESIRQAKVMLQGWIETSALEGTKETVDDTALLALNVLTSAGFGIQYDFNESKSQFKAPHNMSYRDALHHILRNYTLLVILPMRVLTLPFLPHNLQLVGKACQEFKLYMKENVDREKRVIQLGDKPGEAKNLLGALVRASHAEERGLSDEELYGNIFIYNMAGHETTANTLATSIMYLAAMPEWQDWIHEEIVAVQNGEDRAWTYESAFPGLKRCQAVMLETLRLHGSVVFLPKTVTTPQPLHVNGRESMIPENSFVVINSQALHCDTATWGEDALKWRPSRWIQQQQSDFLQSPKNEELIEPRPGTFLAWADGPRVCPGKKFSQVEFTGVLATLCHNHRVSPKVREGENHAAVQKRLVKMIDDSAITAITLQMKRPRDVALEWTRR